MSYYVYTRELITRLHGNQAWLEWTTLLSNIPKLNSGGPWVCGGSVRRLLMGEPQTSDIDVFFRTEDSREQWRDDMESLGATVVRECPENRTWTINGKKVQEICVKCYDTLENVLDSFDYTICQFGFDGTSIVVGQYSLFDAGRKRLAFHRITDGTSTLRRMLKYTQDGYTISNPVLAEALSWVLRDPDVTRRKEAVSG